MLYCAFEFNVLFSDRGVIPQAHGGKLYLNIGFVV